MSKSMEIDARIDELLANLKPITLDEMKEIRLMNRTDTKFVTNKETLARLLEMAQGKYYAQFHCGAKIANTAITLSSIPVVTMTAAFVQRIIDVTIVFLQRGNLRIYFRLRL